jgi:hypothetical protein
MIHTVLVIWQMGNGTEGLEMMREEFEAQYEDITFPTQVRRLANVRTIMEGRLYAEISASFVGLVV